MIYALIIILLIVCYVDVKTRVISDGISLLGILAALHWSLYNGDIRETIYGITCGFFIMWALNLLKWQKVGGGDAKLTAMIGAFTTGPIAIYTALGALLLFIPYKMNKRPKKVAYAPFLTISFILIILLRFAYART